MKEQKESINYCQMVANMSFFACHVISLTVYVIFGIAMNNDELWKLIKEQPNDQYEAF